MTERSLRARLRFIPRLAFELVVVFVGVYAAFALSNFRSQQDVSERRRQIQIALVQEIEDIIDNTSGAARELGSMAASFEAAHAAGRSPLPAPVLNPVRIHNHMWEVTLESGALDLMDVSTVFQLSRFYNELNLGFARLDQLRQLSESMIVPSLGLGTEEFYESPGQLRAQYGWYLPALKSLSDVAERITDMGEELVQELAECPGAAEACADGL